MQFYCMQKGGSFSLSCPFYQIKSIFVFIKQEILLGRIVWPYILDALVNIALVFYFLQISSTSRGAPERTA